ncbi:PEP-CTERM sorting domain-containing protein [Piscinibacter sp.]|jgi:hypothetical protein|uniref:PEP-CTERM sorting domain-containing protein n=1 Tax=Piscinibacter sp. TaxID=1903157 RepID=UPI002F42C2D9
MKLSLKHIAAAAALALSTAASANTLTFEGVTFDLNAGAGSTLELTLTGVASSTGTWADATFLNAFSLGDIGVTTLSAPTGFVPVVGELNASGTGCTGGDSGKFCFEGHDPVSDLMTYTMTYTGTLDLSAPNLKVLFVDDEGTKVGSLLSATIPIPEPDTYALMIAGLGVIGFIARRRQQQQA